MEWKFLHGVEVFGAQQLERNAHCLIQNHLQKLTLHTQDPPQCLRSEGALKLHKK